MIQLILIPIVFAMALVWTIAGVHKAFKTICDCCVCKEQSHSGLQSRQDVYLHKGVPMTTYAIHELAWSKGTSEPVRQALFALSEKLNTVTAEREALQARVAELEKSLDYAMRENP